jgi:hypothetical protein
MGWLRAEDFDYRVKVSAVGERIEVGRRITADSIAWARALGLIGGGRRETAHFTAMSSGAFATLAFPSAAPELARMISDMTVVAFVIDDMADGDIPNSLRGASARGAVSGASARGAASPGELLFPSLVAFFRSGDEAQMPKAPPQDPLFAALRDIRGRLLGAGLSRAWLGRLAEGLRGWLDGVDEEDTYCRAGVVPDPATLMDVRTRAGATLFFMSFVEASRGVDLPPEILESGPVTALREAAGRAIIYPNEILSYPKEFAHGHPMNLITSLLHCEGMTLEGASARVVAMHNADMRRFDELAQEITATTGPCPDMQAFILGLRHYVHGSFAWGWHAARYSKELFAPGHA